MCRHICSSSTRSIGAAGSIWYHFRIHHPLHRDQVSLWIVLFTILPCGVGLSWWCMCRLFMTWNIQSMKELLRISLHIWAEPVCLPETLGIPGDAWEVGGEGLSRLSAWAVGTVPGVLDKPCTYQSLTMPCHLSFSGLTSSNLAAGQVVNSCCWVFRHGIGFVRGLIRCWRWW